MSENEKQEHELAWGRGWTGAGVQFRARATRDAAGNIEVDKDDFRVDLYDAIEVWTFDDENPAENPKGA